MKSTTILSTLALLLLVSGCNTDPGKGKTQAVAAAPVEAPAAAPAATGAAKWQIKSDNSSIEFVGAKISDTHEGSFKDFSGQVEVVENDPTRSKVNLEIKIASLSIEPPKLAGHLLSPDFFEAEKFPTATFESTSIQKTAKEGEFTVIGNLTLRGVKKSISFPAQVKVGDAAVSANAEFSIQRKDFGIVYPGMPDDLIKESVLIRLKLNPTKG